MEKGHGMAWYCNLRRAMVDGDSWMFVVGSDTLCR